MTGTTVINNYNSKVYAFSTNKTWPDFIKDAVKENKNLKKVAGFKNRLEIIQGFEFKTISSCVKISNDKNYIGAAGMYPPEIKLYSTNELSEKFMRRVDSEIIDFIFLSNDYKKIAILQSDKSLEFHNQGGRHHKIKLPEYGRKLCYNTIDAELYINTNTYATYILDLYEGKFLPSFESLASETFSICHNNIYNNTHIGSGEGIVEIFDHRTSITSVNSIEVLNDNDIADETLFKDVSSIDISNNGLYSLYGTSQGIVKLFDIRYTTTPLVVIDHNITSRITDAKFAKIYTDIGYETVCISADEYNVKVWKGNSSSDVKYISGFPTEHKINNIAHFNNSGLIFVSMNTSKVGTYFIPKLGIAPKWVPFIDKIVDEIDESIENSMYNDFEFITKTDLNRLGIKLQDIKEFLKPSQHGFVIHKTVYKEMLRRYNISTDEEIYKEELNSYMKSRKLNDPYSTAINIGGDDIIDNDEITKLKEKAKIDAKSRDKKEKRKAKATFSVLEDTRFGSLFEL